MPYSKYTLVSSERGFTPALSVAPPPETAVAARLEIEGAAAGALVFSVRSLPRVTPEAFVATRR